MTNADILAVLTQMFEQAERQFALATFGHPGGVGEPMWYGDTTDTEEVEAYRLAENGYDAAKSILGRAGNLDQEGTSIADAVPGMLVANEEAFRKAVDAARAARAEWEAHEARDVANDDDDEGLDWGTIADAQSAATDANNDLAGTRVLARILQIPV
jgi:hypothetical protein